MTFTKIDYDAPMGEIQKSFDNTIPVCPFCGGKHSYEIEMTETFTTLYRFRCTVCGATLKMESMSRNPFTDPFLSLEVETSGSVNAANLLAMSAYTAKDLVYFAEKIKNIAPPANKPNTADTARRQVTTVSVSDKKYNAALPSGSTLNDLIGADSNVGRYGFKRRTGQQKDETCRNDHAYGQEDGGSPHPKKKAGRKSMIIGIVIAVCFFSVFIVSVIMAVLL